ncbi:ParB/RepB/Spo0J family partition protein [Actibacterium lipolyticum]|uniref:ParB-like nuclease domain protein n=1 Tax=Actibacterium lipolyticum TaxID=1524263 RepID=A0A238LA38_9RHOB|nr:ParB N-terminal domain-containing protein [Actibacterium lipolyticum]SMX51166.1 ParB-like nuclease domain protein [Actibacterium lipolyticum]
MSKRRVFDIDFPDDTPVPAGTSTPEGETRRGPMASAIVENADALRERQSAEAAIRAENDKLAHEHVRLKKQGLIVDLLPIDKIHASKLTRDRAANRDPDLDELKASIRDIGLSNPIRVEEGEDGYELVQGFRRLSAFRELFQETGDPAYATIPAGLVAKGEALEGLYRRMVDENLVRRDISFAEMAELARSYAADPGTECSSVEEAVSVLYSSAGRQKRSYIRHFATVLDAVGSHLKFADTIPRALGLQLEKRLSSEQGAAAKIRNALTAAMPTTPDKELEVLRAATTPTQKAGAGQGAVEKATAKTTFRCTVPAGTVRCAAHDGRLELRADRDFTDADRKKLEKAVEAFFSVLDQ